MKIAAAIGGALIVAFLSACEGCGSCACGLPYCGDRSVSYVDNGKAFNLEVRQSIVGELFDESIPTYVRSSDPTVLKQVGKMASESLNGQKVLWSGFVAARAGFAQLEFGYTQCAANLTVTALPEVPCSYHVDVNVIQFPRTQGTVRMMELSRTTVHLKSGQFERIAIDDYFLSSDEYLRFRIVPAGVVEWAIMPTTLPHGMAAAIRAVAPGTSRIATDFCRTAASLQRAGCSGDVIGPGGQVESFEDLIVVVAH